MTERFGRACHKHHFEVTVKECPNDCRLHHVHDPMVCPAGHTLPRWETEQSHSWDAFDSEECHRHGFTPEKHYGCVYAIASEEQITLLTNFDATLKRGGIEELPYAVGM